MSHKDRMKIIQYLCFLSMICTRLILDFSTPHMGMTYTASVFTGIIEATAGVLERTSDGLTIERPPLFSDLKIGSSICVSGVCLSVVELTPESMQFDVVQETWDRTKLGSLQKGDRVNLERAMKADSRLEGHIVQGHVDSVGEVVSVEGDRVSISYPENLRGQIDEKGSIAVDGVSLTVASVEGKTFTVALIPQTKEETTLGSLKEGDRVNLEGDILWKYVRR